MYNGIDHLCPRQRMATGCADARRQPQPRKQPQSGKADEQRLVEVGHYPIAVPRRYTWGQHPIQAHQQQQHQTQCVQQVAADAAGVGIAAARVLGGRGV